MTESAIPMWSPHSPRALSGLVSPLSERGPYSSLDRYYSIYPSTPTYKLPVLSSSIKEDSGLQVIEEIADTYKTAYSTGGFDEDKKCYYPSSTPPSPYQPYQAADYNAPKDRHFHDSLKQAVLSRSKSYRNTHKYVDGLRYVCRAGGCGIEFSSSIAEKKHFKIEHIRVHRCRVRGCADRFEHPKQLWRHLHTDHGLKTVPRKPERIREALGCPCCNVAAAEWLVGQNSINWLTAQPPYYKKQPQSQELASNAAPEVLSSKTWGEKSIRKLKSFSLSHGKIDKSPSNAVDITQETMAKPRFQLITKSRSSEEEDRFLLITADQRNFSRVSIESQDTAESLIRKVLFSAQMDEKDFPTYIAIHSYTHSGPGPSMNSRKELLDHVMAGTRDANGIMLLISTSKPLPNQTLRQAQGLGSRRNSHLDGSTVVGSTVGDHTEIMPYMDRSEHMRRTYSTLSLSSGFSSQVHWNKQTMPRHLEPSEAGVLVLPVLFPASVGEDSAVEAKTSSHQTASVRDCPSQLHDVKHPQADRFEQNVYKRPSQPSQKINRSSKHDSMVKQSECPAPTEGSLRYTEKAKVCRKPWKKFMASKMLPRLDTRITTSSARNFEPISAVQTPLDAYRKQGRGFVTAWLESVPETLERGSPKAASSTGRTSLNTRAVRSQCFQSRRHEGEGSLQTDDRARGDSSPSHASTPHTSILKTRVFRSLSKKFRQDSPCDTKQVENSALRNTSQDNAPQQRGAGEECDSSHPARLEGTAPISSSPSSSRNTTSVGQKRPQRSSEDDDDDNGPAFQRRRIEQQGEGKPGKLPCTFAVGEPEVYGHHKQKLPYISQLVRHLNSHGLYICRKCFQKFADEEQEKDHRDRYGCVKSCTNKQCRRHVTRGSIQTTPCVCLETSEQQWMELFKLQYPGRDLPNIFPNLLSVRGAGDMHISPVSSSSNNQLPSPISPAGLNQNSSGQPQSNCLPHHQNAPLPVLGTGFGMFDDFLPPNDAYHFGISPNLTHGSGLSSSLNSSPTDGSMPWEQISRLQARNDQLEQELMRPSEREETLHKLLGTVWQALIETGSPHTKFGSEVFKAMRRDASDIVHSQQHKPMNVSAPFAPFQSVTSAAGSSDTLSDTAGGGSPTRSTTGDQTYDSMRKERTAAHQQQQPANLVLETQFLDPRVLSSAPR